MNNTTVSKLRLHPMIIVACSAIVLLCAVGTAAILGWLPSSNARNTDISTDASNVAQLSPVRAPVQEAPPQAMVAAPVQQPAQRAAPAHAQRSPAASVPPRCLNCGVVESAREITTPGQGSGVGAVGGAVVGGVLGHQVGGGHGKDAMTVLGALGGAFAGNHIEGQVKAKRSYEIVVRLDDGSTRTVHQAEAAGLQSGDRVKIVNGVVRQNG